MSNAVCQALKANERHERHQRPYWQRQAIWLAGHMEDMKTLSQLSAAAGMRGRPKKWQFCA